MIFFHEKNQSESQKRFWHYCGDIHTGGYNDSDAYFDPDYKRKKYDKRVWPSLQMLFEKNIHRLAVMLETYLFKEKSIYIDIA